MPSIIEDELLEPAVKYRHEIKIPSSCRELYTPSIILVQPEISKPSLSQGAPINTQPWIYAWQVRTKKRSMPWFPPQTEKNRSISKAAIGSNEQRHRSYWVILLLKLALSVIETLIILHLASTENVYFILLFMLDSIRGNKGGQECWAEQAPYKP